MQTVRSELFRVPVSPRFFMAGGGDEESADRAWHGGKISGRVEDLPFRVEVWTEDLKSVEQTLAMTSSGSIGFAAYYEATREYPDRYVVLRHKNRIVARWNPPETDPAPGT